MRRSRNVLAHMVAAIGGVIVLIELLRHWLRGHEMEGGVIAVGCLFGFVGAYMVNPKGAMEGGGFVVDSAIKLSSVVFRLVPGRRAGDVTVVPVAAVVPAPEPPSVPDLTHVPAPEKGE